MEEYGDEIHALLVGINDYPGNLLRAPLGDIQKMRNHLQQLPGVQVDVSVLADREATKAAIVNHILQLGKKASRPHTFFFYFSGHGAMELASSTWKEQDGLLKCLVCYDDQNGPPASFLLADKELRYLISHLAQKGWRIIAIFDCCHSGGNTRFANDAMQEAETALDIRIRSIAGEFPARKWTDFVFAADISQDQLDRRGPAEAMPEGRHVQIAACAADELALEINGVSVFTKTLLEVLTQSGGNLSYLALYTRIRQIMRFVYQQQPALYTVGTAQESPDDLRHTGFLYRPIYPDNLFAQAVYNKFRGWTLPLGVIHGINPQTEIHLLPPGRVAAAYPATPADIAVDQCVLQLEEATLQAMEAHTFCQTRVRLQPSKPLRFQLPELRNTKPDLRNARPDLRNTGPELRNTAPLLHHIGPDPTTDNTSPDSTFEWVNINENAEFSFHFEGNHCLLTNPGDPSRPLVKPIPTNAPDFVQQLTALCRHIARWWITLNLATPSPNEANATPLEIAIWRIAEAGAQENVLKDEKNATIDLHRDEKENIASYRIHLQNRTSGKLFVGSLLLSKNFGCLADLLPETVIPLAPNAEVCIDFCLQQKPACYLLEMDDYIRHFNWPGYVEHFKFISSGSPFRLDGLSQEGWPAPDSPADISQPQWRSRPTDPLKPLGLADWVTQDIRVFFRNSSHDPEKGAFLPELIKNNLF